MYYKKYSHTYIKKINLEACCKTFHIEGLDKHHALDDCEHTAKLVTYLLKNKKGKNKKKK